MPIWDTPRPEPFSGGPRSTRRARRIPGEAGKAPDRTHSPDRFSPAIRSKASSCPRIRVHSRHSWGSQGQVNRLYPRPEPFSGGQRSTRRARRIPGEVGKAPDRTHSPDRLNFAIRSKASSCPRIRVPSRHSWTTLPHPSVPGAHRDRSIGCALGRNHSQGSTKHTKSAKDPGGGGSFP